MIHAGDTLPDETRAIYHIDDEETPYLVKLPKPPGEVTLADFKEMINLARPSGFKFFFKSMDDDFGVVKEEIVDNAARLPIFKGRVVSWLVSADGSTSDGSLLQNQQTLSRRIPNRPMMNKLLDERALAGAGNYDYSYSESVLSDDFETATDMESVINVKGKGFKMPGNIKNASHAHYRYERAHGLLSDVESTTFVDSEDEDAYQTHLDDEDYEELDDESDLLTAISATTDGTSVSKAAEIRERRRKRMMQQSGLHCRQGNAGPRLTKKHPQLARLRSNDLSRASSFTSITDSTMSLNIITVTLQLNAMNFLGISIVGQSFKNGDGGIYVGSIMAGGAVAADGRIDPGDMLLQVNEVNFENLSNDKAVEVLREAVSKPGPIKLVVAKCCFPGSNKANTLQQDASGGLNNAEIFAYKKNEPIRPIDPKAWVEHTKAIRNLIEGNDLEQRPESVSTISSFASTIKGNSYKNIQLTTDMDMLFISRAMAAPDSDLEVKDRMWLKIVIPNAVLGSEVVDWLFDKVQGFQDRKEAKKYASAMLKQGYIKHTVNKSSFSEQCYYTFGDMLNLTLGMNSLNLNDDDKASKLTDGFVPWSGDMVNYGVLGASHLTGNEMRNEQQSMQSGNNDMHSASGNLAASSHLASNSARAQLSGNPPSLTSQMLLQHTPFPANFTLPGSEHQDSYFSVPYLNGGSSNSSETQSSLNTQSTRDTAIGVSSGSNPTLGSRPQLLTKLSNANPSNDLLHNASTNSEIAGHENEVNNDDEHFLYN